MMEKMEGNGPQDVSISNGVGVSREARFWSSRSRRSNSKAGVTGTARQVGQRDKTSLQSEKS